MSFKKDEDVLRAYIDPCFKAIFTENTEDSKATLSDLISAFIGRKVQGVTVLQNEPAVQSVDDKQIRYDICCQLENGVLVDVEISLHPRGSYEKRRVEYYLAKLFTTQDVKGDRKLKRLKKTYLVSILVNGKLFEGIDFVSRFEYYEKKKCIPFGGQTKIITAELDKLKEKIESEKIDVKNLSSSELWGIFLRYAHKIEDRDLINEIIDERKEIGMAAQTLSRISRDHEMKIRAIMAEKAANQYDDDMDFSREDGLREGIRKGKQEGRQEGIQEGRQEGIQKEKIAIAQNMINSNFKTNDIAKLTGLTPQEIQKLRSFK